MLAFQLNPLARPAAVSEILLLLAGSAFVGWLLARWFKKGRNNDLPPAIDDRQGEPDASGQNTELTAVVSDPLPGSQATVSALVAAPIQSVADNLKLVDGIGPKIEGLLNADGIRTFAKLAATSPQHIARVLSDAGPRYQMHNPETWPQQASLARDGKWEELKSMQSGLAGGRK